MPQTSKDPRYKVFRRKEKENKHNLFYVTLHGGLVSLCQQDGLWRETTPNYQTAQKLKFKLNSSLC